ncbi:MAG: hypothetical protein ABI655_00520 [Phenylobacterium sp.]
MPVYRIYLMHDDGRLEPGESFYCGSDADAVPRLQAPARRDLRAELWQGGRFVAVAFQRRGPVAWDQPGACG